MIFDSKRPMTPDERMAYDFGRAESNAEAAAQLRHVSDLFCTPAIKLAALMGAEALEVIAALAHTSTDRKEQTT